MNSNKQLLRATLNLLTKRELVRLLMALLTEEKREK